MRLGQTVGDDFVADQQREWQIGQPTPVHVAELTPAESQFGAAKPVRTGRHTRPGRHGADDRIVNAVAHISSHCPAPGRKRPRGAGVGSSTISAPRTPTDSPPPCGADCTASRSTIADW